MDLTDFVENLRPECKICYEKYSDSLMPKMLHCSHSFCKDCIQKLVDKSTQTNCTILRCPCCRKKNKFQAARGVDSFRDNIDLRNVVTMLPPSLLAHGEGPGHDPPDSSHPVSPDDPGAAEMGEGPAGPTDRRCQKHDGAEVNRYCTACSTAMCNECVLAEHYEHAEAILGVAEYAQRVKEELLELLRLAQDLPFLRIKSAAERTRQLALAKKGDLLREVDRVVDSKKEAVQGDLRALDDAKQTLRRMGNVALDQESRTSQEVDDASDALLNVESVLKDVEENTKERDSSSSSSSLLGLEFIGMKPDGSIGDFIKGKLNIVGHVVDEQSVVYVADNRKPDSVVLIGISPIGNGSVSKWIMSFRTEDKSSPVVFSSQILHRGKRRLLLIAVGRTLYTVNLTLGDCIADQIQTIHVKEGVILLEESFSINGVDWFHDDLKQLAIISLNTGKSLYLIDATTKALLTSTATSTVSPSILSCRRGDKGNLTIARDASKLVVLNQNGHVDLRLSPSKAFSDYLPWVSCWVSSVKPLKIAVVWCKSRQWKIALHDSKGKVVKELPETDGTATPVSIAYNEQRETFVVCSTEGTSFYP